jgi:hypothetical protein
MDTPAFQSRGMDGVSCEKGQITVTAISLLAVSEGERLILPKLAQVVNPQTTSMSNADDFDTSLFSQ